MRQIKYGDVRHESIGVLAGITGIRCVKIWCVWNGKHLPSGSQFRSIYGAGNKDADLQSLTLLPVARVALTFCHLHPWSPENWCWIRFPTSIHLLRNNSRWTYKAPILHIITYMVNCERDGIKEQVKYFSQQYEEFRVKINSYSIYS